VSATHVLAIATLMVSIPLASLVAQGVSSSARADDEAWWENPCEVIVPQETPTGTRMALEAVSFLSPPGLKVASRRTFELELREGQARVRMRLSPDASALYRPYDRPELRYRFCQEELAGRMAEAFSFRQGWQHGFVARWADAYRDEWLTIVIVSPTRGKTGQLRRLLLSTLEFPAR
jgi:hypothetical protein